MYQSNLKKIREEKNMTQAELSTKSGINLRTIQNYEQGFKDINSGKVINILALAEALGCDVYKILNPKVYNFRV